MVHREEDGPAGSKGAIKSPVYAGMKVSAGTEPGTFAAERKPNRPIMAKRPLFTSAFSFFAFCSSVSFLVYPNGSQRLSGDGCTLALRQGHQAQAYARTRPLHVCLSQLRGGAPEGGHVARLAATHVMLLAISRKEVLVLGDVLEDANSANDLQLRQEGDGVPHLGRAHAVGH